MPNPVFDIKPIGSIDRRNPVDAGSEQDVLSRENFYVLGVGEGRFIKKMPGSTRLTPSALTTKYTSGFRYYSGNIGKTFALNANGNLYHIAPNGTATAKIQSLSINKYGSFEIQKVSGNNVAYFVNGSDGMYSYDGNGGNEWKKEDDVSLNFVQILGHLDRLWGFTEDSEDLYFSKTLVPTDFTDSTDAGSITIGAKRGSKIQAIALLNETIYILKGDSIYVLLGRTPSTFEVREIHPYLGVASRWSVQNVEGGLMFLGSDYEVYSFGGTMESTVLMTYNVALSGEGGGYNKDVNAMINKEMTDGIVATFHNHLYRMSFTESGDTVNRMEYIYNTINKTDGFTRGNNVSCYIPYSKTPPDQQELITGRADTGLLMTQYRGVNYDDGQSGADMQMKTQTKFIRPSGIKNIRFKKVWLRTGQAVGSQAVRVYAFVDGRNTDSKGEYVDLAILGETTSPFTTITLRSQDTLTSRAVIPFRKSRGQSISYKIDMKQPNLELAFQSFTTEAIGREIKRSKTIGV